MSVRHSDNALITSPHGHGVIIIYRGEEMFELQFNLTAKTLLQARKTMKWVHIGNLPKPNCEIKAIVPIPYKFNTNMLTNTPLGENHHYDACHNADTANCKCYLCHNHNLRIK